MRSNIRSAKSIRRKKIIRNRIILGILIVLLLVVCIIAWLVSREPKVNKIESPFVERLDWEVGSGNPTLKDFNPDNVDAEMLASTFDTEVVSEYEIKLMYSGKEFTSILNVIDTQAPIIEGVKDITIYAGESVSYKQDVTVTDNYDADVQIEIDNSNANLNQEGVYTVTYIAVDSSGNKTTKDMQLTVKKQDYDVKTVYSKADAVLASIFKAGMTDKEKLRAIYNYVLTNIGYINYSQKGNYIQGAYEGLVKKQGDCYVYACTTKILLDRAGIKNMDIAKIPSDTSHYWNLVDIGEGWYHLDTTPRKDHPTIFYWDDEQLMAYSVKHDNSHNYDHSAYPKVN